MDGPDIVRLQTNDHTRLTETRDYLFLLELLRRHRPDWKYYTTLSEDHFKARFFLAEDRDGRFFHPLTGQEVFGNGHWQIKERIRPKKVRDHFFARYRWRDWLQAGIAPDETIRAGRLIIWKGGKFKRIRQLIFSLSRRYPLGGRLDQLIESPEAYLQHVAELIEEASESHRQDRYFCPLDGVVKPIEIVSSSPAWTWDELCGREWTSEVCPHCLFGFSTRLTAMN